MLAAVDEVKKNAIFRFSSPTITDRQWRYYLEACERLGAAHGGPGACLVCISDPGSDLPNAPWRRRFAEVATRVRTDTTFVLISPSPMARGIVTAVNWIRPFRFQHRVVGTWAEALRALGPLTSPTRPSDLDALLATMAAVPA